MPKLELSTEKVITCKNCHTEFKGNYCPQCGQSIMDYEKPFGFVIYDLMGNIFAFDTRLWRTLKAVLFQPGKMAREFIQGHRVRYMPPFRFYVFISFIFFVMLNYSTQSGLKDTADLIKTNSSDSMKSEVKRDIVISIDTLLSEEVGDEEKQAIRELLAGGDKGDEDEDSEEVNKKIEDILTHPNYYLPQFYKYFSWILFFIMPLYGSLLWLFFNKKYRYYLGHIIFAINQHSFLFIIFILIMGTNFIFPNKESSPEGWLIWLVPIYSIIGAKRLYQRRWRTIILKLLAIFFMYGFVLTLGVILAGYIAFAS